jgi:vacuolar protein sorting-associated protein 13A/C
MAVKPAVGVLDLATQTTKGIRNTATYWDTTNVTRVRPPRYVGPDKILRVFDAHKAEGAEVLYRMSNGKYKNSMYLYHKILLPSPDSSNKSLRMVMVTNEFLFLRKGKSARGEWKEKIRSK